MKQHNSVSHSLTRVFGFRFSFKVIHFVHTHLMLSHAFTHVTLHSSIDLLDVLEDYLSKEPNMVYDRIDGDVAASDRQPRIDRFNAPQSPVFIFLLSTRACRLGINLATADTVIIYDSDWNPHNDIQAFSRVHRIGQNKKVMVYRLVMKNTIEEVVVQKARSKLVLEHLVVNKMQDKDELKESEVASILKVGAKELFTNITNDIYYDDATLDNLLDRSQVGNDESDSAAAETEGQNVYFGSLKDARVWEKSTERADDHERHNENKEDFWQAVLSHKFAEARHAEEINPLGKGQRVRKQVRYYDPSAVLADSESDEADAPPIRGAPIERDSSSDYSEHSASSDEEPSEGADETALGGIAAGAGAAALPGATAVAAANATATAAAAPSASRKRNRKRSKRSADGEQMSAASAADLELGALQQTHFYFSSCSQACTASHLMSQLDPERQRALVALLRERMQAPMPMEQATDRQAADKRVRKAQRALEQQQRRDRKAAIARQQQPDVKGHQGIAVASRPVLPPLQPLTQQQQAQIHAVSQQQPPRMQSYPTPQQQREQLVQAQMQQHLMQQHQHQQQHIQQIHHNAHMQQLLMQHQQQPLDQVPHMQAQHIQHLQQQPAMMAVPHHMQPHFPAQLLPRPSGLSMQGMFAASPAAAPPPAINGTTSNGHGTAPQPAALAQLQGSLPFSSIVPFTGSNSAALAQTHSPARPNGSMLPSYASLASAPQPAASLARFQSTRPGLAPLGVLPARMPELPRAPQPPPVIHTPQVIHLDEDTN